VPKHVYFKTMGCQMNVADSQRMETMLIPLGYTPTENIQHADLIIINTCSVREKPFAKVKSFLGTLTPLKKANHRCKIIVTGCVAQQVGNELLNQSAIVDWVLGTDQLDRLPELVASPSAKRQAFTSANQKIDQSERTYHQQIIPTQSHISTYVVVMKGCDQFCSYCIVPYTRGRERSRPLNEILDEIKYHLDRGCREIVLLGQNIDTYGKYGTHSFCELLYEVHSLPNLWRLRFLTSHPRYFNTPLIQAFVDLPNLCDFLHLPIQSGSDTILKRMNRRHTRKQYEDTITKLRKARPNLAISSDFIVGFPGETEQDFLQTLDLVHTIQYDQCFSFMYSPRPHTVAHEWGDDVPYELKKERLYQLQKAVSQHLETRNQALLQTIQEVLVEGKSHKDPQRWTGRTSTNKVVNFEGEGDLLGKLVDVSITVARTTNLQGKLKQIKK
jgi:tRNA-2-methylthio-N6-dimethylallyladenosine synthase